MSELFEGLKAMLSIVDDEIKTVLKFQAETLKEIKEINETDGRRDSLEIGTPGKQGALKIYFNSADPTGAKKLIDNALAIRQYANSMAETYPMPIPRAKL